MLSVEQYWEDGKYIDDNYQMNRSTVQGPHMRLPLDNVLVGITGKSVFTQDELALTYVSFVFRQFLPSSHNLMVIKQKKYEYEINLDEFSNMNVNEHSQDNDHYEEWGWGARGPQGWES